MNVSTSLPASISGAIRSGQELVGDDYSPSQIARWFAEEKEAFFAQDDGNSHIDPFYAYMRSLTVRLAPEAFGEATASSRSLLVLGPGPGLEVDDVLSAGGSWEVTFVEASERFRTELAARFTQSTVVPAKESGALDAPSASIDVVLALSVLHHIPNVSFVLSEFARVLRPGGLAVIREPCSSMGDWRGPRSATPNERGIGKGWMAAHARQLGLDLVRAPRPVLFHPLSLVTKRSGGASIMRTPWYFWADLAISRLLQFNDSYWRDRWYKKLAPSAYFYLFRKAGAPS